LKRLDYYRDIAILACSTLPGERPLASIVKSVKVNNAAIDLKKITGEDPSMVKIEKDGFLQFEFKEPIDVRQVSFITAAYDDQRGPIFLQSSEDGKTFNTVATFSTGSAFNEPRGEVSFTQNIPSASFRFLRLACNHVREFTQIRFSNTPRASDWQKRANFAFNREGVADLKDENIPAVTFHDISDAFIANDTLNWRAPKGEWTIIRIGYTPIGTMNRSAPDTGVGLECDKFSASAIEFHFNKMMEHLLPTLKEITVNGKAGLLIDSYEVGMQNWTQGLEKVYFEKNGYAIDTFLPALTGRIVTDVATTNKTLWDFRRTLGELMSDNYYGKFTELCHKNDLISYCQPYDRGPMEEMQIGSRVDTNVGEFWNGLSAIFQNNWTMRRTVKLSAAIAHTNGQKIVAAESYTGEPGSGKWQEYPFGLKALGDKMFTQGLNRMVFHRFAHQPHPAAAPGMTMGPWGSHFDRTNTWWEQGKAWMDYLTRCQYMLQAGTFFADLVYFTGESAGVYTRVERNELVPPPPEGYDYDLINAELLLTKAKVVDKKLTLPDGVQYSMLVLQDFPTMTGKVIKKIQEFINGGLTVVGKKPVGQPGFKDDPDFGKIVNELWDGGKVIWNRSIEEVLKDLKLRPDFEFGSSSGDAPIMHIHRRIDNADVYFITNQRRSQEILFCHFRVTGKRPEVWDPVSGTTFKSQAVLYGPTSTRVDLPMNECGSIFIVFRDAMPQGTGAGPVPVQPRQLHQNVQNSFTIHFWAKPESNVMLSTNNFMDGQKPWTDNYATYPSPGEKLYGSGHATCGLTVGRNGVAVWEHSSVRPSFVFSVEKDISSWTHIALTYNDGTPSIFVNGEMTKQGPRSGFIVHPGLGHVYLSEGASFFNGDIRMPTLAGPLTSEQLISVMSTKPGPEAATVRSVLVSTPKSRFVGLGLQQQPINTGWSVAFPPNSGAPAKISLENLIPLNKHSDDGVKYFSGTCTYTNKFKFEPKKKKKEKNSNEVQTRYILNLGAVEVIAEVTLNGKSLGTLWTRPFMIDATEHLVKGDNELIVKVTNLWPNRLIGDEQQPEPYKYTTPGGSGFAQLSSGAITELPEWYQKNLPKPDDGRVAFATWKHYVKTSPLLESGLIGPVVLFEGT
ncbi:MAG TPA: glycosyl hydrolase, partial [Cyclobacteriaceae bacterium]|nr:glycosyl hydrolase [Cyclobacteriaceae bacterium]